MTEHEDRLEARGGLDEQERVSAETAERDRVAAEFTRAEGVVNDTEEVNVLTDPRGRQTPVVHGTGAPGEPETLEQGLVRTGRKQPEHAPGEDSAGLVPDITRGRVEHTRAQRDETHAELQAQGEAADGDGTGSGGPQAPRGDGDGTDDLVHTTGE